MNLTQPGQPVWKMRVLAGSLWLGLGVLLLVGAFQIKLPQEIAVWVHTRLGYYFSLLAFFMLGWFVFRCIRKEDLTGFFKECWRGAVLAVAVGLSFQFFQDAQIGLDRDEPRQQMVAESMHEWRQVSTPQVGYHLEGELSYGSHRLVGPSGYFYSFLVSFAHDVFGFRVAHGWLVNALLGIAFCWLIYLIGAALFPSAGGACLVLLAAGLPLLDQAATSYGDDLTHVTFLALLFLSSLRYVRCPDKDELGLLLATAIVLMLCRAESLSYLLYVAVVLGAMAFTRRDKLQLGWVVLALPLFAVPVLAGRSVGSTVISAEGFGAVPVALQEELALLGLRIFDFSLVAPVFPLLSLLGLLGLCTLAVAMLLALLQKRAIAPGTWLVAGFTFVVLGTGFGRSFGSFSSSGTEGGSLLPLHLILLILSGWWLCGLKLPGRYHFKLLLALGAIVLLFALPARMAAPRESHAAQSRHVAWALDWLAENDEGRTLYVTPEHLLFLLHDFPTVGWGRVESDTRELMQLVREGYYDQVIGFLVERYDVPSGNWTPVGKAPPLSDRIIMRGIEQRRYAFNERARFFEIEAYIDGEGKRIEAENLEAYRERQDLSFDAYIQLMRSIHPGYR